ncbi:MAG: hypothetical protein IH612_15540 [Desulfofustis sp.]|nr:hypothetical protein [Desulfofustis sp.]
MMDPLEDEWYAVRYSGEIPEVALHSAFHYLCEDENGPQLVLTKEQGRRLIEAAAERFREIILRDLLPDNRSSPSYRGVRRSIINWRRYLQFCRRQQVDHQSFRHEVAAHLLLLLNAESVDWAKGRRGAAINCSFAELTDFALQLGLVPSVLPEDLKHICG